MLKESVKILKYRSKIVQRCSKMIKDAVKMLKESARWWVVINDRFQATKNEWKCEFNEVGPWADSSTSCGWLKKTTHRPSNSAQFNSNSIQFRSISTMTTSTSTLDAPIFFLLLFDALKKKKKKIPQTPLVFCFLSSLPPKTANYLLSYATLPCCHIIINRNNISICKWAPLHISSSLLSSLIF